MLTKFHFLEKLNQLQSNKYKYILCFLISIVSIGNSKIYAQYFTNSVFSKNHINESKQLQTTLKNSFVYNDELFVQRRGSENPFSSKNPWEGLSIINSKSYFDDLDNDGDLDIVNIESLSDDGTQDVLVFYEATLKDGAFFYEKSTDDKTFRNSDFIDNDVLIDKIQIIDFNNDGLKDVICHWHELENHFTYLKNIGINSKPEFQFQYTSEIAIYDDMQFYDMDNDGDCDIFSGPFIFENISTDNSLVFENLLNNLGINFNDKDFLFMDIDNDNDPDFIRSDGIVYLNIGTVEDPKFEYVSEESNPFQMLSDDGEQVVLFDIDGDGDIDVLQNGEQGVGYFQNVGNVNALNLEAIPKRILSGKSEDVGFPKLVDIDADGDFDIVHFRYNDGGIYVYENKGNRKKALFENYELIYQTDGIAIPTLVDIDFDGDLDMFLIEENEDLDILVVNFLENTGSNNIPEFILRDPENNPLNTDILESQVASTCFVDIDDDDDFDLFVSGETDIQFYENIGTPFVPIFKKSTSPINLESIESQIGIPYVPNISTTDYDNDGDYDVFIGARTWYLNEEEYSDIKLFENKGDKRESKFELSTVNQPFSNLIVDFPVMDFADMDGDGDADCIIHGWFDNNLFYFENVSKSVSSGLNIKEFNGVYCYPNPVHDVLNIANLGSKNNLIEVYSLWGKLVKKWNVKSQDNQVSLNLNVSTGVYIVSINGEKHKILIK